MKAGIGPNSNKAKETAPPIDAQKHTSTLLIQDQELSSPERVNSKSNPSGKGKSHLSFGAQGSGGIDQLA